MCATLTTEKENNKFQWEKAIYNQCVLRALTIEKETENWL